MTISELYQNAKAIDLADIFSDVIAKNEEHLIQLNQNQLYKDSSDSEGNKLEQYNSLEYAREKESMNPEVGFRNTDLYYTGAFYRGWSILVTNSEFLFDSSDSKTSDLIAKYGENIFGFRKDNLESFTQNEFREGFFSTLKLKLYK